METSTQLKTFLGMASNCYTLCANSTSSWPKLWLNMSMVGLWLWIRLAEKGLTCPNESSGCGSHQKSCQAQTPTKHLISRLGEISKGEHSCSPCLSILLTSSGLRWTAQAHDHWTKTNKIFGSFSPTFCKHSKEHDRKNQARHRHTEAFKINIWILTDVFKLNVQFSPPKLRKLMITLHVLPDCKCWSGLILSNYSLLHPPPLSLNIPLCLQGFPSLHTTTRANGSTIINQHKEWFNQMSFKATKQSIRALKILIRRNIKQRKSV